MRNVWERRSLLLSLQGTEFEHQKQLGYILFECDNGTSFVPRDILLQCLTIYQSNIIK